MLVRRGVRHARPARRPARARGHGGACPCSPPAMARLSRWAVRGRIASSPRRDPGTAAAAPRHGWASPGSPTSPASTASGVPVVTVVRPNARSLAVSQGKGLTLAAAKVSAIMEAAELYHAETVSGPAAGGRGPTSCGGERAVRSTRLRCRAPPPRPAMTGRSPGSRAWTCVAAAGPGPVRLRQRRLHASRPRRSVAGSSPRTGGLGAGNDRDEAVAAGPVRAGRARRGHALARSAARRGAGASAIDPATIDDPASGDAARPVGGRGLRVRVWDATSDVGAAGRHLPARRHRRRRRRSGVRCRLPSAARDGDPRARCSRRSRRGSPSSPARATTWAARSTTRPRASAGAARRSGG